MRLAGHTLAHEGAPFMYLQDGRPYRVNGIGTGGLGRGLCSCGAMSPQLFSGEQRRKWHREHKASPILVCEPADQTVERARTYANVQLPEESK